MKSLFATLAFAAATLASFAEPARPAYSPVQIRDIFFVLGMHIEYFGKTPEGPDIFFSNEQAAQEVYFAHSEKLRASLGLKTVEDAWRVIDSFYKKNGEDQSGKRIYLISDDAFIGYGDDAAFGYLAGAAVRHWQDGCFRFANGTHKAQVVGWLLAFRDCGDVEVRTYPARIPNNSEVRLQPSPAVKTLIESAIDEREKKKPNQTSEPTAPSGRGSS